MIGSGNDAIATKITNLVFTSMLTLGNNVYNTKVTILLVSIAHFNHHGQDF